MSRRARNYAASTGAVLLAVAALWTGLRVDGSSAAQSPSTFAATVANLSERGGYFDTDNLISNERSYLQVVSDLKRRSVQGGAYIMFSEYNPYGGGKLAQFRAPTAGRYRELT